VIGNFLRAYRENDTESIRHSLDIAVEGHMLAFAAEEARVKRAVIDLPHFKQAIL
jgi:hypothetical protein